MTYPLVLLFGEDPNDTHALAELTRALLPSEMRIDTKPIRKPPVLQRGAASRKRATMAQTMAAYEAAERKRRPKVVVVAHRDCDDVEPAHLASSEELEADMRAAGIERPVAATPCWELEAWWMLFPEALAQTRRCWRSVDYSKVHVGYIRNAKERLTRDLRPEKSADRGGCEDFAESDGATVARHIKVTGVARDRQRLRSGALQRFLKRIESELSDVG